MMYYRRIFLTTIYTNPDSYRDELNLELLNLKLLNSRHGLLSINHHRNSRRAY